MPEETLLSVEEVRTRAEIATQLRLLADGLNADGPLTLTAGEQTATVTPPNQPKFELEVEREYDEGNGSDGDGEHTGEISIEVEIEWDERDVDRDGDADTPSEDEPAVAERDPAVANDDAERAVPIEPDRENVPAAATGDAEATESLGQFQLYVDRAGKWRWRLVHRNANIIAASGQGYASRQKAEQGMQSVMRNAPDAEAVTVE